MAFPYEPDFREPDFREQPIRCFLYGWPAFLTIVTYLVWFHVNLVLCLLRPLRHEEGLMSIDRGFFSFMLPPLMMQMFAVGVYTTWMGWKFFQRN